MGRSDSNRSSISARMASVAILVMARGVGLLRELVALEGTYALAAFHRRWDAAIRQSARSMTSDNNEHDSDRWRPRSRTDSHANLRSRTTSLSPRPTPSLSSLVDALQRTYYSCSGHVRRRMVDS